MKRSIVATAVTLVFCAAPARHCCHDRQASVHADETAPPADVALPRPHYAGTVKRMGPMAHARLKAGAALLPNGNVLLAGGGGLENGAWQRLNDAEVFNPRTGRSTPVGNLTTRRTRAEAVSLDNGKVLVIAGCTWMLSANDSCDLYDPVSHAFTAVAGSMVAPRSAPQAIQLNDGRVFISGHSRQPEIYDPAAGVNGTFTATAGRMAEEKGFHSLTLLADGRVLILGGLLKNGTVVPTAELYDPDTGAVASAGKLTAARWNHFAVRLDDGRVLIGGGTSQAGPALASAEIYDPAAATFTPLSSSLREARFRPQAIKLTDGNVLVSGDTNHLEVYVAKEGAFRYVDAEVVVRTIAWAGKAHRLVELNDHTVLITGGVLGSEPVEVFVPEGVIPDYGTDADAAGDLRAAGATPVAARMAGGKVLILDGTAQAQLYDPVTDDVQNTGTLHAARRHPAMATLRNGKVLVAGGEGDQAPASAEIFDPARGTFTESASRMNTPRGTPVAVNLLDGRVLLLGDGPAADLYDYAADAFTVASGMRVAKTGYAAGLLGDGRVLVSGGATTAAVATAELFQPATGKFSATGAMVTARHSHFQVTLRNGQVLAGGGVGTTGLPLASAELYDPATGNWTALPKGLSEPCVGAAARLLGTGKILIAGGRLAVAGHAANTVVFVYDPAARTFSTLRPKNALCDRAVVVLKDGRALLVGGKDATGAASLQTEVIHPADNYCTVRVADMLFSRRFNLAQRFTSGPLADQIIVTGGAYPPSGLSGPEVEIYDPATDSWRQTGNMQEPKRLCTKWLRPDGKLAIAGGDGGFSLLDTVEVFDPATETWTYGPAKLTKERGCPVSAVLNDGRWLVIGTDSSTSDLFHPDGSFAGTTGPYRYGRGLPGIVHWRNGGAAGADTVLLIGGYWGPVNRIPYCELYRAATNDWVSVASMNRPRGHLRNVCKLTRDDLVWVSGGWDDTNAPQNSSELYDRIRNTWTPVADPLVESRGGHVTTEMPNGWYFLIGQGGGGEWYDHATGLYTWAGKVHGPAREQFSCAELPGGAWLYVGGAGKIAEKLVP